MNISYTKVSFSFVLFCVFFGPSTVVNLLFIICFIVLFMYVPVYSCHHHHHFLSCYFPCSMCFGVSNWTVICFYQQAKQNLGPGEYDLKSFLHELNGSYLIKTVFIVEFFFSYILIFYTVIITFIFFLSLFCQTSTKTTMEHSSKWNVSRLILPTGFTVPRLVNIPGIR